VGYGGHVAGGTIAREERGHQADGGGSAPPSTAVSLRDSHTLALLGGVNLGKFESENRGHWALTSRRGLPNDRVHL
jgi:hypothetical protein